MILLRLGLFLALLLMPPAARPAAVELADHDLAGSVLGYVVIDPADGRTLDARQADRPFIPASTIKLLTALGALDALGPDTRLETVLLASGEIGGGRLAGDLVLRGGGDLELDMDGLMQLVLALRRAGIATVDGRFLVDDGAFLRLPEVEPSQPVDAPYNAGIGPLALAFSRVTVRPSGRGEHLTLPPLVERGPAWRIVTGLEPPRARPLPVRDVGMHAARVLGWLASHAGIALPAPERAALAGDFRQLARLESKPVAGLVQDMLLYSNNQLAETLGLVTSTALGAHAADLASSAAAVAEAVEARLPADWSGLVLANHSGLSPATRATPRQLAALLAYGLERFDLPSLLPVAGWSGSLEKRLIDDGPALRVWAKTGSLDYASALAGYLLAHDGLRIFVVMIADEARRAAYDALPEPTPAMRRDADDWEVRAKALQDELIRRWLDF